MNRRHKIRGPLRTLAIATELALALSIVGCGGSSDSASPGGGGISQPSQATVKALSSRPDMVTGGDAVVEVSLPAGVTASAVLVTLNGADAKAKFVTDASGTKLTGLVDGLNAGDNALVVSGTGIATTNLTLTNFPATGPVFSGPRQRPWVCQTQESGLGAPPTSGPCVAPVKYEWFYRSNAGQFVALPSLAQPYPADLAQTTTIDGTTVNYIVRVESGVINESIYRIAVLDDPAHPTDKPWAAAGSKPSMWNGKLTWPFGGGCTPGYISGSNTTQSALQDVPLKLGFAVAFGTRNTLGTGCDDVISAETVMMIKERFIEQYGVPKFTIGSGGSGGSMQQRLIAQNYPGLLDAITPDVSFSDLITLAIDVLDCRLLGNYFDVLSSSATWPGSRRATVDGYAVATSGAIAGKTSCQNFWSGFANRWQSAANGGFSAAVPTTAIYNPITNPTGIRGTYWDGNVNSFGKDPATGFARSAYSNEGVQYGLQALNSGAITPEEFVDMNERIGGLDIDGNIVTKRSAGDPIAIKRAYATGRITNAFDNLTLPAIDTRVYRDFTGDIHTRERTMIFLDRMRAANGTTANQVNWMSNGGANSPALPELALRALNSWLENMAKDTATGTYAEKVIRNKPADLKDTCWVDGAKTEETFSMDPNSVCNKAMPIHSNPRLVAGSPLASNVLKCALKPIDFSAYSVAFTDAQKARLQAAFATGVCDWSVRTTPPLAGTWLNFGTGRWGPANIYGE